jgi:hypothetical protein
MLAPRPTAFHNNSKGFLIMKIGIALLLTLTFSYEAFTATRIRFLPMDRNFMANVMERDIYGNPDSDAMDLYKIMNVEEQDSMLGKGKSIVTPEKDFNLVCSREKKQCSIILNRSANTVISSANKVASFKISGEAAGILTKKFKLNERGEAYFQATDKLFRILGTPDTFVFEAHAEE